MEQRRYAGIEFVRVASALAQRIRGTHRTAGLFEAADLQWWWRTVRSTDLIEQTVWFDDDGPMATTVATDWGDRVSFAPMALPDAPPDRLTTVIDVGLRELAAHGIDTVDVEVRRTDDVVAGILGDRDFAVTDDGVIEAWLDPSDRRDVSPLHADYRCATRAETAAEHPPRPHHMVDRSGTTVEARLRQTDLYRPDLDLVVVGHDGDDAGYGLFWFDPATRTGLVEPMRTEEAHRRRGIARHVITTGLDRLATAGAERVKICVEPGNDAALNLYLDVGFEPVARTDVWSGPTA